MRRGKPAKAKVKTKLPVARKSPKKEAPRVHELEKRLAEALAREAATSEILGVIASSPTDVQPVFDTIIQNAVRLLGGFSGVVTRIVGGQLHLAALTSTNPAGDAAQKALWPKPVKEDRFLHGQVITALEPRFVSDVESDPSVPPGEVVVARARGYRSIIAVPLVRDDRPLGSMTVTRRAPGPFSDSEIALLRTFADQAVIAIENVRLFTELQEKNQALTQAHAQVTEALEQQTATAEVLKVISHSTFDLQPVLETVIEIATKLCDANIGVIHRFDGELFRVGAFYGSTSPEYKEFWQGMELRPGRGSPVGGVGLEHRTVQILDVLADPEFQLSESQRTGGFRTAMGVPMLREGMLIGAIFIGRTEVRAFTDSQIALVQTFADQAVKCANSSARVKR